MIYKKNDTKNKTSLLHDYHYSEKQSVWIACDCRNEELIRVEATIRLLIRNIRLPQTDI